MEGKDWGEAEPEYFSGKSSKYFKKSTADMSRSVVQQFRGVEGLKMRTGGKRNRRYLPLEDLVNSSSDGSIDEFEHQKNALAARRVVEQCKKNKKIKQAIHIDNDTVIINTDDSWEE